MVKKLHKSSTPAPDNGPLGGSVKDSAQQIWQAGLGAFAKAQAEGTRAFETLVKEGVALQRKTQAAAEGRIAEATSRVTSMANDIGNRASGHWDKLENIFEERVAKALNKLGVPSSKDVSALIARIDELKRSVQELAAQMPDAGAKAARGRSRAGARPEPSTAPVKAARAGSSKAAGKRASPAPRPAARRRSADRPAAD